jgi:hypothetical protein
MGRHLSALELGTGRQVPWYGRTLGGLQLDRDGSKCALKGPLHTNVTCYLLCACCCTAQIGSVAHVASSSQLEGLREGKALRLRPQPIAESTLGPHQFVEWHGSQHMQPRVCACLSQHRGGVHRGHRLLGCCEATMEPDWGRRLCPHW